MSTISTFSGFTMARLGIMASSKALEVTGNNISNINTVGYTRQVLDQRALYIGGADRYSSQFDVRVGAGALTTGVSQLRDPYLDIRYRNENASVGFYEGKYNILEKLSLIFDEVGKGNEDGGVIEAQLNDLLEQLQTMNTEHAGDKSYDANVRQSAKALAGWFNSYAKDLEQTYKNTMDEYKASIGKVNNLLTSIRELNESIKKAEIGNGALSESERQAGMIGERGRQALELRDERNKLIDELSSYLPIDVKYSDESIGSGMTVEKLTITLKGNSDAVLVDGLFAGTLSVQNVNIDADGKIAETNGIPNDGNTEDPYLRLQISTLMDKNNQEIGTNKPGGKPYKLLDQTLEGGSLQAQREMLTKTGEYSTDYEIKQDAKAATKRGIKYYQNVLDALANKVAKIFNDANTIDKYGASAIGFIDGAGALFSNSGDGDDMTNITAKNISISSKWQHGEVKIIQTRDPANNGLTTANDNIAHLISLMQQNHEFAPSDIAFNGKGTDNNPIPGVAMANPNTPFFTGTFQGMLTYINEELGGDMKSTGEIYVNHTLAAEDLDMSRESVSGVDLNDEAVNMMQYQKSYSAACRLLTTLDEILDKLINGTGIAGR